MKFNKNNNDLTVKDQEREFGFFNPFFDDFFASPFKREFKELSRAMKTDIKENEKAYEMQVEMPGFDKNDIKMHVDNGYLTISAEKSENNDEKDKNGNFIKRERRYGSCSRSFYIGDVDEKTIDAKLEQGILTVNVPKETKQIDAKKYIEIK